MREHITWQNRFFQVDLWERDPFTVKISEGDDINHLILGKGLAPGKGHLSLKDGSTIPYFVSAAPNGFWVTLAGETYFFEKAKSASKGTDAQHGGFNAPMPGKIIKVNVKENQAVEVGEVLVILEAMKMEHRIQAPQAGTVKGVHVKQDQLVEQGFTLLDFEPEE